VLPISWKRKELILEITQEPLEDSELNVKRPREFFPLPPRPLLKSILWPKPKTSSSPSLELNSKNCAYPISKNVSHLSKRSWKTPESERTKSMMSYWSEDPPEFPKFNLWSKISSMEKNPTDPSTLMKPSLMVLPFKPLFWPTLDLKVSKMSSYWM